MSIAAYLSNLLSTTGIVKPAALGTGTPSSSNFLRGDGAWADVASSATAKAWVRWVGSSGTVTSSYNVSSVTRNSTGNYTVNFTSALANANYAPIGMTAGAATYNSFGVYMQQTSAPTTSSCAVTTLSNSGTAVDCISNQLVIFGS